MADKNKEGCCNTEQIVSDFYDKILAYVRTKVQDVEVAKDITQEVMGRLILAYEKNTALTNTKAWLYQVSRNLIVDYYRKKKSLSDQNQSLDSFLESDEIPDISTQDFIIPMIKLLPEEYAKPLYLSDIENLKQSEIAESLGLKLSATKMRIQRARKMLHALFTECCEIQYAQDGSFLNCTIKQNCNVLLDVEKDLKNKIK